MMSSYTGRRFVNPLSKNVGRRTGKDIRAGKNIRVGDDGFENFDDYFSESDADVTRELSRIRTIKESESQDSNLSNTGSQEESKENQSSQYNITVSHSMPGTVSSNTTCSNITAASQSSMLQRSQGDPTNSSKFGWLRNRNIGRRTGKNFTANKQIRVDENGFENFDDYLSESDISSLSSGLSVSVVKPRFRRSRLSGHQTVNNPSPVNHQDSQKHHTTGEVDSSSNEDHTETEQELVDVGKAQINHKSNTIKSSMNDVTRENNQSNKSASKLSKNHSMPRQKNASQTNINTPLSPSTSRSHVNAISGDSHEHQEIESSETLEYNDEQRTENETDSETDLVTSEKTGHAENTEEEKNNKRESVDNRNICEDGKDENTEEGDEVEIRDDNQNMEEGGEEISEDNQNMEEVEEEISDDNQNEEEDEAIIDDDPPSTEEEYNSEFNQNMQKGEEEISEVDQNTDEGEYKIGENNHNMEDQRDSQEYEDEHPQTETDHEESEEASVTGYVSQVEPDIENNKDDNISNRKSESNVSSHGVANYDTAKNKSSGEQNSDCDSNRRKYVTDTVDDETDRDSNDCDENGDLMPSQAETNIDVGGNKSGSITKLDFSNSVVSFNKTRKRLSYSALAASKESIEKNKTRIEKANSELYPTDVLPKSNKGQFHQFPKTDSAKCDEHKSIKKAVNKKAVNPQTVSGEDSEFLCLTSRSVQQFTRLNCDVDSEDIEILDYDRKTSVSRGGRNMTIKGKNKKKATQRSDIESQRDNEKHIECVINVSKSEVKMQKTRNNKSRRKTTHGTSHGDDDMDINVKKGNRKKKTAVNSDTDNNVDDNDDDDLNDLESNEDSDIINDIENNMNNKSNNISKHEVSVDSRKRKGMNLLDKSKNVQKATEIKIGKKHKNIETLNDMEFSNSKKLEYFENTEGNNCRENEKVSSDHGKNHTKKSSKKDKNGKNLAIEIVDTADCVGQEVEYKGKTNKTEQKKMKRKSSSDEHHSPELNFHNDSNHDNNVNAEDDQVKSDEGKKKAKKTSKKKLKRRSSDEHSVITYNKTENKLRKTLKRKSSSEDNLEDDVEIQTNTSKAKTSKLVKKSRSKAEKMRGRRGKCSSSSDHEDCTVDRVERSPEIETNKANKSKLVKKSRCKAEKIRGRRGKCSSSSSSDHEVFTVHRVERSPDTIALEKSVRGKKSADSRFSVPTNFGSGVSFRVSRRSELLENVQSGYIGEVTVHLEPTGGLTPCISRAGAARKSKGRRVTICPMENTEHNVTRDISSEENERSTPSQHSTGRSAVNVTPLPDHSSTPVHYYETTRTSTPHPGQLEQSIIDDGLIKPSPPEEGLRRSRRTRLKPIAWYKNEQVVFDYRRRSGPAIIGVKPSLEVRWNEIEKRKCKRRKLQFELRKASRVGKEDKPYRKLSIHRELPKDLLIEDQKDEEIMVYNQNLQSEDGIDCIARRDAYKPVGPSHEAPKKGDPYLITKQLDHPCMSAGIVCIKPNAEKPESMVTADYVVFNIEYGKMLVTIHKTTTLLETGDKFMVPTGNTYSISNLRADTARLSYVLHKQTNLPDRSTESSSL